MTLSMLRRALALCAVLAGTASAQVVNGDFESSFPAPAGSFSTYSAGQSFGGWTVGQGSIDLINGFWQAANGTYSIDLDGASVGSIYQNIITSIGGTYSLSFAIAGNPAGPPVVKTLNVLWGGTNVGSFTFDVTGHSFSSMGWQNVTINNLVATSALTHLEFQSATGGTVYGPALDAVSVSSQVVATPEPASVALLATGLIAVAGVTRRRKRAGV